MVVYRFKFDEITAASGVTEPLLGFLESLCVEDTDVFNYLPSKKDVIIGVGKSIHDKVLNWIKHNVNYKFEYEEHSDFDRMLVQYSPNENPAISICYLLPLFTPESYLEL
jgi:hypothetical protein